jgi:imidazolonepropionase-like amidohydrolase
VTIRIDADLLIPGRGEPIANGTVITEGGTITYAGPSAAAPGTSEATVTQVPVVMPGLWECHGHLSGITTPDLMAQIGEGVARRAARAVGDLSRTLMGGVTSMREVGGLGIDIQPAIAAGDVAGPTVYGAGNVLSTTGGHGDVHSMPLAALDHIDHFGMLCDGVPEVTKDLCVGRRDVRDRPPDPPTVLARGAGGHRRGGCSG